MTNNNTFVAYIARTLMLFSMILVSACDNITDYCAQGRNSNTINHKASSNDIIYPINLSHYQHCAKKLVKRDGCINASNKEQCMIACLNRDTMYGYKSNDKTVKDTNVKAITMNSKTPWQSTSIYVGDKTNLQFRVNGTVKLCNSQPSISSQSLKKGENLHDFAKRVLANEQSYYVSNTNYMLQAYNASGYLLSGNKTITSNKIILRYGEQLAVEVDKVGSGSSTPDTVSISLVGGSNQIYLYHNTHAQVNRNYYQSGSVRVFVLSYGDFFNDDANHNPKQINVNLATSSQYKIRLRTLGCYDSVGKYLKVRFKDYNSKESTKPTSAEYSYADWSKLKLAQEYMVTGGAWRPSESSGFKKGFLEFRIEYPYPLYTGYTKDDNQHYLGNIGSYKVVTLVATPPGNIQDFGLVKTYDRTASYIVEELRDPVLDLLWGPVLDVSGKRGMPTYYKSLEASTCTKNGQKYPCNVCKGSPGTGDGYVYYKNLDGECVRGMVGGVGFEIVPRLYNSFVQDAGVIEIVRILLVIYIILYGMFYILGVGETRTLYVTVHKVVKLGVIAILISPDSWEFFRNIFFGIFIDTTPELIEFFAGPITEAITGIPTSKIEDVKNFSFIDKIFSIFIEGDTWVKIFGLLFTGWNYGGLFFTGLVMIIMMLIAILLFAVTFFKAMIAYIVSIVVVAFLIMVAPIFITFSLFSWSANMFKHWLDYLIAYFLQPIVLFTSLAITTSLVINSLDNVLAYTTCWKCIQEFSLDIDSLVDIDLDFCLLAWFYPEGWGESSSIPGIFFKVLIFMITCEIASKISAWSLSVTLALSSVIDDAVGASTQRLWSNLGLNRIEATVKSLPNRFGKEVARSGVAVTKQAGDVAVMLGGQAVKGVGSATGSLKAQNIGKGIADSAKNRMGKRTKSSSILAKSVLAPVSVAGKAGSYLARGAGTTVKSSLFLAKDGAVALVKRSDESKRRFKATGKELLQGLGKVTVVPDLVNKGYQANKNRKRKKALQEVARKEMIERLRQEAIDKGEITEKDEFKLKKEDGKVVNAIKHRKMEGAVRAFTAINNIDFEKKYSKVFGKKVDNRDVFS